MESFLYTQRFVKVILHGDVVLQCFLINDFRWISPLLMNPHDRLHRYLWANQRIQLMEVDDYPEQIAASRCHNYHSLDDS